MNAIEPANDQIELTDAEHKAHVGAVADVYARSNVFADYAQRKAANTLSRQRHDLALFAAYLTTVQFQVGAEDLQKQASAWSAITYGLVAGFVPWQLQQGYAVSSINVRLSTVKQYAKLAFQAGTLDAERHALIRTVSGFQFKEQKNINQKRVAEGAATRRDTTRTGAPTRRKVQAVTLTNAQVKALKQQPNTAQGRRDALLMCLLLDHGLRCGEIAALDVTAINVEAKTFTFYRAKVSKTQTHKLSPDTLRAAKAWFASGDAPALGKLLRASAKSKDGHKLGEAGMSERAITKRVEYLGRRIGVEGLSAHDGRHNWATRAARNKTDSFALQEAGGWNSLAMPRRYVEEAKIANEGVNLGEDQS